MTDARRQAFLLSILCLIQAITLSSAHRHHKHGQQCNTAWSATQAHFSLNQTTSPSLNPNTTQNTTGQSPATHTQQVNISGIPWQYEGKPIKSTVNLQEQVITVKPPPNQANQTGQIPGGQVGFPCLDAGVLFSCTKCDTILSGQDCYKKIGDEQLDNVSSGEVACDLWYTRTGYGEGGGVTMCGTKAGDIFQCSSDKGLSECEPCMELGTTSPS